MKRIAMNGAALIAAFLLGSVSAVIAQEARPSCASQGPGEDSFCTVNGARLHFIDWGGSGPAVILLAGLGNTARIYDDLAPQLSDRFHVLAFTRRGYGLSQQTPANYSNATLVGDVLALMDALSIAKASFVGHSIAGGELSTLAADHAARVERLVYLDAAYDRTDALKLTSGVPIRLAPSPDALESLDAFSEWRQAAFGVHSKAVDRDVRAIMRALPSGGIAPVTPDVVGLEVLKGDIEAKPRYAQIAAPALAIYSSKDVPEQVPPGTSAQDRARFVEYAVRHIRPWMLRAQADFIEQTRCGVAMEVPKSTHYLFLQRTDWTADAIGSFLQSTDPCHWSTANPAARAP